MTVFHPGYCFPTIRGTSGHGIYLSMHASSEGGHLMSENVYKGADINARHRDQGYDL